MTSHSFIGPRHGSAAITLPSDTEIVITRVFDASADLVFDAWTMPAIVRRWWAGDRGQVTSVDVDLRAGGGWRFVMIAAGGFEVAFHGEYREIDRPRRLVRTEVFEGFPEAAALSTMTLDEVEGVTTMRILVKHSTPEYRDRHLASGMESGMQAAFDCLEDAVRPAA